MLSRVLQILAAFLALPVAAAQSSSVSSGTQADFCAASSYQVLGQAWRVDFSTGGLIPRATYLPPDTVKPPILKDVFKGLPISTTSTMPNATIVVVDNFSPITVRSRRDAPVSTGQIVDLEVRHGALVRQHIVSLLESDGFKNVPAGSERWKRSNRTITVRTLDYSAFKGESAKMTEKINATLENIKDPVVLLNMSFVLIRCEALQTIQERNQRSLEQRYTTQSYLTEVANQRKISSDRAFRWTFEVPADNPLLKKLAEWQRTFSKRNRTFLAVASSGNHGARVPSGLLMPASLPTVIGVGATNWQGGPPGLRGEGNWSSPGDTQAVGEWYTLPPNTLAAGCPPSSAGPLCVATATDLRDWPNLAYRGTSFSAPAITSLLAARWTRSSSSLCSPTSMRSAVIQCYATCSIGAPTTSPRPVISIPFSISRC